MVFPAKATIASSSISFHLEAWFSQNSSRIPVFTTCLSSVFTPLLHRPGSYLSRNGWKTTGSRSDHEWLKIHVKRK
ncbi:hypothetical protein LH53_02100 [Mesotoga sp. TolDC]|nr:hypothetical protein LH53_02100 [Mesotoga sp. TolDC]